MPIAVKDGVPDGLRPYTFHGLDLSPPRSGDEATCECPWCGKPKFGVNVGTGLWKCLVCAGGSPKGGGNVYTFLRMLWELGDKTTADHHDLAADRGLLDPATAEAWGCVRSPLTGEWLVPGYDHKGEVCQLYRYVSSGANGTSRRLLLATPTLQHGLFGPPLTGKERTVYVCEGPWDGMTLWEALGLAKRGEGGGLHHTGNPEVSLRAGAAVVAVPGCNTWRGEWGKALAGRDVALLFDNDHPRKHPKTGAEVGLQGYHGMRRLAGLLGGLTEPPTTLRYLRWGPDGYDPGLKSGYDVRDRLTRGGFDDKTGRWLTLPVQSRVVQLDGLLGDLHPIPADWVPGRGRAAVRSGGTEKDPLPCTDWGELTDAWKKAMKWTEGLDRGLSALLACALAVPLAEDQLWVKLIGPPSCGKTTLAEGVSVAREYVYPKDTLTGLLSGYQSDREGGENMSPVLRMRDKLVVINDGDTILKLPNRDQILSQLRAFYGRNLRSTFLNKMSADFEGYSVGFVVCGTESLRELDTSELGQRFLDVVVMELADEEYESGVNRRKLGQLWGSLLGSDGDGADGAQENPRMVLAKRLTGGYVNHLRRNAHRLVRALGHPDDSVDARLDAMGQLVAFMRARPSTKQDEDVYRELSTRLVGQLGKLALCLAVVLGRGRIDAEVMRRVTQTARDTARGKTLRLAGYLYDLGADGCEVGALATWTGGTEDKVRALLRFLRKLGAVEPFNPPALHGVRRRQRWRLTERLGRLYGSVIVTNNGEG